MPAFRCSLPRQILILLLFTIPFTFFHGMRLDVIYFQDTQFNIHQKQDLELAAFHPLPGRLFIHRTTTDNRLPLDQLIAPNNTIVGDVQFLLDFSIIGFGKCGTSTIMHWLADHEEIKSFRTEIWDLMGFRPDSLIRRLYQELPEGDYKRGYKVRVFFQIILVIASGLFSQSVLFATSPLERLHNVIFWTIIARFFQKQSCLLEFVIRSDGLSLSTVSLGEIRSSLTIQIHEHSLVR